MGIGRYYYNAPDSTFLQIQTLRTTTGVAAPDSSWKTYSANSIAGCSMDLVPSILETPLLSVTRAWTDSARLTRDTTGVCEVTVTNGPDIRVYTVDKGQWLVTGLSILGGTYSGRSETYLWAQDSTCFYPRKVSFYGDTTLASGGYEFFNVLINAGAMPVKRPPGMSRRHVRAQPLKVVLPGRLGRPAFPVAPALFDVKGRPEVATREIAPGVLCRRAR